MNVKVGDKVIYSPAWGVDVICVVTEVTKAGNFRTDKTGKTLFTPSGTARGAGTWDIVVKDFRDRDTDHMYEYTEAEAERITRQRKIAHAYDLMKGCCNSHNLSEEQADGIIRILGKKKSE